jgi:hypothetical protein
MLDPKLTEKMNLAYARIGELGYQISLNMKKGKDHLPSQQKLWDTGLKMWQYLKILFRHVDTSTTPPTLIRIEEVQVNKLLRCLEKLGQLDKVPAFPSMLNPYKPIRINQTLQGPAGDDGENGTNANITVEPETGESDLTVREEIVGSTKKYYLSVDIHTLPQITVEITAPKIYSKGVIIANKNVTITTTKGNQDITSLIVSSPAELNTAFQATLNLAALNAEEQPVITTLAEENVDDGRVYTLEVSDGIETVTATDTLYFYFPYLYGASDDTSFDRYVTLTKLVLGAGTTEIPLLGEEKYFWICFPSSYLDDADYLIRDLNGLDVTSAFIPTVEDVTSDGLDADWTEEYVVLRTEEKTDISGTFTIEFIPA